MRFMLTNGAVKTRANKVRMDAIRGRYHTTPPDHKDKAQWMAMWEGYAGEEFLPDSNILETTWQRLFQEDGDIGGLFLYETKSGGFAGFLHYVLHRDTWHKGMCCYVNDGYIAPKHRPRGGIIVLYDDLITMAKRSGWEQLHWMTKANNLSAQRFYDRIATRTDWIRYEHELGDDGKYGEKQ